MTAINQHVFNQFSPVATPVSTDAASSGHFRQSEEFRLIEALREGGPQTALTLGRRTQLPVVDVWEWAARKAAVQKLDFDPETQFFSLPQGAVG
ncbi:MAG: hypothetical protein ACFCUR_12170 [Rhodomicrobiaceae bacterium]